MAEPQYRPVDHALAERWLTARSIARGLPAPVREGEGWRVETGLPQEARRHVFIHAGEALEKLGREVNDSTVVLKLFAPDPVLRAAVLASWSVQQTGWLMILDGAMGPPSKLPPGYTLDMAQSGSVSHARILAEDGAVAASGYAAETPEAFVYDRIRTDPDHRRRGLGAALMTALGAMRRSAGAGQVLVATDPGRALYATLGWSVMSPYSTAMLTPD